MVEIPQVNVPDVNYSNVSNNLMGFATKGYIDVFGVFFWPLLFSIVILCTYLYFRSAVLAVSIALIIFATLGNTLIGVELWTTFIHIALALAFTMMLLLFIIKRREK